MNAEEKSIALRLKVGLFTAFGLALIAATTVLVSERPLWQCTGQLVQISLEDATGLKIKSPVRSLGIQVGYLKTVELTETHVKLGICITSPVQILPTTRASLRAEGFLGDKFLELKPLRYVGDGKSPLSEDPEAAPTSSSSLEMRWLQKLFGFIIPSAQAVETKAKVREIPVSDSGQDVQQLVNQVNGLVGELKDLTGNLKKGLDPDEMKKTMTQLNKTLENAAKTLSPEGNLTTTAQRALAKLEDAIEQLRDMLTRVNQGKGSVGMLLNDPVYAEEIKEAIRNVNKLLSNVGGMRFIVDVNGEQIKAYDGMRGSFRLAIWPNPTRYYVGSSRVDLQACKLEYSIVSPK